MNKSITLYAAVLLLLAIVLGAFGAHGLKQLVSAEKIVSFETGVRYQFYTGISLLTIALNASRFKFSLRPFYSLMITGQLLFSVSIYLLTIQKVIGVSMKFLGPVTPLGGSLMIIGWVVFIVRLAMTKPTNA